MSPWRKTFISAFAAQVLSVVGFSFCLPFLPFFIGELGVVGKAEQAWWAGIVMSAAGVTLAVFSPLWGILADRYGRKAMVLRSMFGGTIVLLLMSTVQSVGQLVVCRLLQGMLTGTVTASIALVASVTPSRRSGFTLGMMQAAVLIGVSIGPPFGGMVADHFGYRNAFRVGALVVFLGGLLVHFGTREEFSRPDPERKGEHGSLTEILTAAGFVAAVSVLFTLRFSHAVATPSFPLIVKEILGETQRLNSVTGSIMAVAGFAGAISAGLLGYFGDSWGHRRVLIVCSLCAACVSFAHVFAHSIAYLFVVRGLFGLALAGMMPATNAIIRGVTTERNLGKAFGTATSFSMAGLALGPFVGGYLGRTVGLRVPFVVMSVGQLLVLALAVLVVRSAPGACARSPRLSAE